VLLMLTKL